MEDDGNPDITEATIPEDDGHVTANGWWLEYIEMENFKSYKGKVCIGPLKSFMAVIGPNGSGKSNFMDAISFVMGERAAALRVRRLNELIHGAAIDKPVAKQASVSATLRHTRSQAQRKFSRVIRGTACEYLVNRETVNHQRYLEELAKLDINVKGKNFLVFQGAIESITLKSPKERTALLEEISGSGVYKDDYDKSKAEMTEMEQKIHAVHLKKKGIMAERKEMKLELEESKKFTSLLENLAQKDVEIQMFKLWSAEDDRRIFRDKIFIENRNIEKFTKLKGSTDGELQSKKKERGELSRMMTSKESDFHKAEQDKNKVQPKLIELQQKIQHQKKKLQSAERSLKQAKDSKFFHEQDLVGLQKNLEEVQKQEEKLVEDYRPSQLTRGVDVTLHDSQMEVYWNLKRRVIKNTATEKKRVEELQSKKSVHEDVFNSVCREKSALEGRTTLTDHEINEMEKLISKINAAVERFQEELNEKQALALPLEIDVKAAEGRIGPLEEEIETIIKEIENMKINRYEETRMKRKQEVLDSLKRLFVGVYDRVMTSCKPRHSRYAVAITKILGKNMEAIVVDTAATARQCIQYLKEQMHEPEVFLPLDLLEVKPLKERFRNKSNEVHLAFDMVQFNRSIEKAILHCTKSTVVCQTPLDAKRIAAGEMLGEATNAVSLDGTLYATSGIISGGQADLRRKVQRWNANALTEKESRREQLRNELKEAKRISRRRIELDTLLQEIDGLNKRIKFATADSNSNRTQTKQLEIQKQRYETEHEDLEHRWKEAETIVTDLCNQTKKIQAKIDAIEDKEFAPFCNEVGIPNIRAYEDRDVKAFDEFNRKREEIQRKQQQIQAHIDYENAEQKSLADNISRWESTVQSLQDNLNQLCIDEEKVLTEISAIDNRLAGIGEEVNALKISVNEKSKEILDISKNLTLADKALFKSEKERTFLQNSLAQCTRQRQEILTECKLNGINIPLINGTIDEIHISGVDSSLTSTSTQSRSNENEVSRRTRQSQSEIEVNYESLSETLRKLPQRERVKSMDSLQQQRQELESAINQFRAPNMKANQRLIDINERARQQQTEFEELKKKSRDTRTAFEDAKKERFQRFMKCYEKISENIDGIYKDLTQNQSAQAILGLDNPEEPYLDGVSYNCVAPGKRFQSMSNLSGGEKTIAALALLLAIHSSEPTPFFVLDEIDAALDNTNIGKVTSYIKEKSKELQIIIISLKEEFYGHAQTLIGITPDLQETECIASKVFSLDLSEYDDD